MSSEIFGHHICVGGLPGIGSVGKVAADCISTALECRTLRSLISSEFPAQVMLVDGLVKILQVELKAPEVQDDLLVFSGDAQPLTPTKMYQLAGEILESARSFGASEVITLAAYVGDSEEEVFGVTTDASLAQDLERNGIALLRGGIIGGLNGILVGLAPFYGMRGTCLMGKTSGEELVDLVAAKNLIVAAGRLLNLEEALEGLKLEDLAQETYEEDLSDPGMYR